MTPRRFGVDELLAVAVGGVVGALARYGIALAVPRGDAAGWPWATLLTNLVGCLLLGLLLALVESHQPRGVAELSRRARLARPFLASGVLGGFTTFSTFSVEAVELVDAGRGPAAAAYVACSVVLGVALVAGGRALGATTFGRGPRDVSADIDL